MGKLFGKKIENKGNQIGMSEEQRLQDSLMRLKKVQSEERLRANLGAFREGYRELVMKCGIKFIPILQVDAFRGITPVLVEQECMEEIDQIKKQQGEVKKTEADGVIKQ